MNVYVFISCNFYLKYIFLDFSVFDCHMHVNFFFPLASGFCSNVGVSGDEYIPFVEWIIQAFIISFYYKSHIMSKQKFSFFCFMSIYIVLPNLSHFLAAFLEIFDYTSLFQISVFLLFIYTYSGLISFILCSI